jgi:hypothetical protein
VDAYQELVLEKAVSKQIPNEETPAVVPEMHQVMLGALGLAIGANREFDPHKPENRQIGVHIGNFELQRLAGMNVTYQEAAKEVLKRAVLLSDMTKEQVEAYLKEVQAWADSRKKK